MSKHDEDTRDGFPFNMGFRSYKEFNKLVTMVPLNSQKDVDAFERWKTQDGTRDGLLHLLGVYVGSTPQNYVYENVECRERWFDFMKQQRIDEFDKDKRELQNKLMADLRDLEILRRQALLK